MGLDAESLELTDCVFVDKILSEFLRLKEVYSSKEGLSDRLITRNTLEMILREYQKIFQEVLDTLPRFPLSPSHKNSAKVSNILAEAFCYYQKFSFMYQSRFDTTTHSEDFSYNDHLLYLEKIKTSLNSKWLDSLKKEQLLESVLAPPSFQRSLHSVVIYENMVAANDSSSYLSQIKSRMIDELERMQYAAEQLEQSSLQLEHFHTLMLSFGSHFRTAFHSLQQFKLKAQQDSRYSWYSFLFFILTCSYIFLKRLRVFRMIFFTDNVVPTGNTLYFSTNFLPETCGDCTSFSPKTKNKINTTPNSFLRNTRAVLNNKLANASLSSMASIPNQKVYSRNISGNNALLREKDDTSLNTTVIKENSHKIARCIIKMLTSSPNFMQSNETQNFEIQMLNVFSTTEIRVSQYLENLTKQALLAKTAYSSDYIINDIQKTFHDIFSITPLQSYFYQRYEYQIIRFVICSLAELSETKAYQKRFVMYYPKYCQSISHSIASMLSAEDPDTIKIYQNTSSPEIQIDPSKPYNTTLGVLEDIPNQSYFVKPYDLVSNNSVVSFTNKSSLSKLNNLKTITTTYHDDQEPRSPFTGRYYTDDFDYLHEISLMNTLNDSFISKQNPFHGFTPSMLTSLFNKTE